MRLFVTAVFVNEDHETLRHLSTSGKMNDQPIPQQVERSVPTTPDSCNLKDNWEVYPNMYLPGFARHCNNTGDDQVSFPSLELAMEYLTNCHELVTNYSLTETAGRGITKDRVGIFTIRNGIEPGESDSCEISWLFIP